MVGKETPFLSSRFFSEFLFLLQYFCYLNLRSSVSLCQGLSPSFQLQIHPSSTVQTYPFIHPSPPTSPSKSIQPSITTHPFIQTSPSLTSICPSINLNTFIPPSILPNPLILASILLHHISDITYRDLIGNIILLRNMDKTKAKKYYKINLIQALTTAKNFSHISLTGNEVHRYVQAQV